MQILFSVINIVLIFKACGESFSSFNDDYISIDDLPLQDARLVRADVPEFNVSNVTTENPFVGRGNNNEQDWSWLEDALKDIAYYLRSHKFNEFDRRYETDASKAVKSYYLHFPKPPLRSLHWEVHKYCDISFLSCVEYVWKRVKAADLKRMDDTAIVIQEQHWKVPENSMQIDVVEIECQKFKKRDNILANPFQGPLERFQWRTTASYFMCWYTMNDVQDLRHLTENCDNFASCLDPVLGSRNQDFRANDDLPFACALYSFCPDPCCGKRRIGQEQLCWESPENPCSFVSPPGQRKCVLNRKENTNFKDIVLNRWNVTCKCPHAGYVWDSSYGICVDIDECLLSTHTCDKKQGEACLNTPGSYKCVCKWGYSWYTESGTCKQNGAAALIKLTNLKENKADDTPREKSIFRRLYKRIFRSSSHIPRGNLMAILVAFVIILY